MSGPEAQSQAFQDLNKRLGTYIFYVQQLKQQNSKLQDEVTTVRKVSVLQEVKRIDEKYASELTEVREKLITHATSEEMWKAK